MGLINMIGFKFGEWTVISRSVESKNKDAYWKCICTCGNTSEVSGSSLRRGLSKQCKECHINKNIKKTGLSRNKKSTYSIWSSMKDRCLNKNNKNYMRYGGRGITICESWLESYENFHNDMGERPKGYSIERINGDGNYSPENCRWATMTEQNRNRCNNKLILDTETGIYYNSISEFVEIYEITVSKFKYNKRFKNYLII